MEIETEFPAHMTWDQRRQLADDIANLSPPDLKGAFLLLYSITHNDNPVVDEEPLLEMREISSIPTQASSVLPHTWKQPHHLDCSIDLDKLNGWTLKRLKEYVDECFIPHYVPKENCNICEGLWSSGKVIGCGRDQCGTRVHEECFGALLRTKADGPWYCPSCLLHRELMCCVCMQYGGALKLTTSGNPTIVGLEEQKWVHVLCALVIPELIMRDVPTLEPVDGFDEIENGRFRYLCCVCRKRGGASVTCEREGCNIGMHPQCAANAGLLIGSDTNAFALYCEKHLPENRIYGAKRWISDEDLVEEIISNESTSELTDDMEYTLVEGGPSEQYKFVLESTAGLDALLRSQAIPRPVLTNIGKRGLEPKFGAAGYKLQRLDTVNAVPGLVVMGMRTATPLTFPPSAITDTRIGAPKIPIGEALINAIIDCFIKEQGEWMRATVLQYDSIRKMHLIQFVNNNQRGWIELNAKNTLVLYIAEKEDIVSGPRVRLYRPLYKGVTEWRPKPQIFA